VANNGNLRPPFTASEARENGKKGGVASAKARRAAKVYADAAKAVLASKFKTSYAGKDLREMCKAFGFGDTETGAIMLALSDFLRGMQCGDKDSIDRLLNAAGMNSESAAKSDVFESPQIYVMPSAKDDEDVILDVQGDEDDAGS
jgi:hypothetical protein